VLFGCAGLVLHAAPASWLPLGMHLVLQTVAPALSTMHILHHTPLFASHHPTTPHFSTQQVATARVKGAAKLEIPHVDDHVSKIDCVGLQVRGWG